MAEHPTLVQVADPTIRRAMFRAARSTDSQNQLAESPSFWVGTQGDYDALSVKDPNTIYMILE